MNIYESHKPYGLVIEVSEAELQEKARRLCEENGEPNLLTRDVLQIVYTAPTTNTKSHKKSSLLIVGLMNVLMPTLVILGIFKLFEIIYKVLT